VNGLVTSINQFLGLISLCDLGVGAVVQSTLYEPLSRNDMHEVSKIVISAERFFKNVARLLIMYTLLLVFLYPLIHKDEFDYLYTASLILVISISTFAQYYFGMTYRQLLNADQLGFIVFSIQSIVLILNTIICYVLMEFDASIQLIKLVSSLLFVLQPILFLLVARRKYALDKTIVLTEEPIKQKWNGLAQNIASVVLANTDVFVLTIMSSLENVSIYGVYHMIVAGVKQIIISMSNGMLAMLGNMLALGENEKLNKTFDVFEWVIHTVVTIAFSVTALLIVPFVKIYTTGVNDADYIVPLFAGLITLAEASYCLRLPYNMVVMAACHYKQTQRSAIIEALINVLVSVILVHQYGLIGVAVGTLVAMSYRTIYFAIYLQKNILKRKLTHFVKHVVVDLLSATVLFLFVKIAEPFYIMNAESYLSWMWLAVKIFVTCVIIVGLLNFLAYKYFVVQIFTMLKRKKK
jgi:O-antigen/teichoic acid export membrane protein